MRLASRQPWWICSVTTAPATLALSSISQRNDLNLDRQRTWSLNEPQQPISIITWRLMKTLNTIPHNRTISREWTFMVMWTNKAAPSFSARWKPRMTWPSELFLLQSYPLRTCFEEEGQRPSLSRLLTTENCRQAPCARTLLSSPSLSSVPTLHTNRWHIYETLRNIMATGSLE